MWLSQELLAPSKSQAPIEAGEAPCEIIGEEIQRLSVLQNLPQLLEGNESLCMQKVVPKVQMALPNASTEFHMAASTTFKTILEKKLVHPRTFTQTFLQSILSSIDSRDPVVATAWVETLLDVIDLLPPDVVKSDILPISIVKGQISQRMFSRIMACKLLGKICTRVDQMTLKKETLPVVLSLCQDTKGEVRACICGQLPFLAQGLGAEGVKPTVLPILVELASDEESIVRLAAVEAIVCMLPYLQQDTLKNTIVPLVKKTCESAMRYEDNVMVVLAQVFGELCLGLEATLSSSEKKWMLRYYQQLSELGLRTSDFGIGSRNIPDVVASANNADRFVECRHHCAFHFPAMMTFGIAAADNFEELLYPVFNGLSSDPYFEVRRTMACGLHEVARVLDKNNGVVKAELVKLLRDDSEEVLEGLIPNLSKTLILLAKSGSLNSDYVDNNVLEVGRALLKCESEVSATNNWRLHELLVQQFECLHLVLPSDFIHTHFTPMLFSRIHRVRQVPVRLAASRTLLVILRYNTKNLQKTDIRSRIISELGAGRSCFSRMSFLRLCGQALELFSRRYFKEHFYLALLERAEDKVPNIRLMLVHLLPQLKFCLRLPSDKKYFAALESSIRKLLALEKDRDVLAALDRMLPHLDRVECMADNDRVTLQSSKEDQEDQRKFEEETRLGRATKGNKGSLPTHTGGPAVHAAAPPPPPTRGGVPPPARGAAPAASVPLSASRTSSTTRSPPPPPPPRVAPSAAGKQSILGPELSKTSTTDRPAPQLLPSMSVRSNGIRSSTTQPSASHGSPTVSRLDVNSRRYSANSLVPGPPGPPPKDSLKSLEDEFYRDAGIKIPQQFSTPTKIPNLRETLAYKSRNILAYAAENRDAEEDAKKEDPKDESTFAKGTPSRLTAPRKVVSSSDAQRGPVVVADRRHGYLATEKAAKTDAKVEEGSHGAARTRVDTSRRHSYIERVQVTNQDTNPKGVGSSQSTTQVKKSSFLGREQTYRGQTSQNVKPAIPLRRGTNRPDSKPDGDNRRRSLNFGQGERIRRGLSMGGTETDGQATRGSNPKTDAEDRRRSLNFGQERGFDAGGEAPDNAAKRRSLVAPGLVSKMVANRRHSSLERDDVEKGAPSLGTARYGSRRSPSPRLSKEDPRHGFPSDEGGLFASRLRRPGFVFKNDAVDDFARRDRLGKIPRSNNSSPGNSRSASPSGVVGRGRHLTAPNSRAGSPTPATKRLSLGTLNSYMTNMKLTEPSSRLPVRKK